MSCKGECKCVKNEKDIVANLVEELRKATDEGLSHQYLMGLIISIKVILEN